LGGVNTLLPPPGGGGGGDEYTGCVGGAAVDGGVEVVGDVVVGVVVLHVTLIDWVPDTPPEVAVMVELPAVAGAWNRAVTVPLVAVPEEGVTWPDEALSVTAALVAGRLPAPTSTSSEAEPPQFTVLEAVWMEITVGVIDCATPPYWAQSWAL
jgi:hypothetical protein